MRLSTLGRLGAALAFALVLAVPTWAQSYNRTPISSAYADISAAAGSVAGPTGDDASSTITFPSGFTFPYYGTARTSVRMNTNGWANFDGSAPTSNQSYTNVAVPTAASPNSLIAPFWDDLNVTGVGATRVALITGATAADDRIVLQWKGVIKTGTASDNLNFQTWLYRDGRIEFHYSTMAAEGTSFTVGIENDGGTAGSQVFFDPMTAPVLDNTGYRFVFVPPSPPANDNVASARVITTTPYSDPQSNVGATREAGEAPASCVTPANDGAQSIWYSYTPSVTGSTTITAGGFDTILSVYTGMAPSLTEVACRDASTGTESATLNVTAGTRYYIRVNGYAGATGTATVTVSTPVAPPVPPANDNLAAAIAIAANGGTVTGTNVNATREAGEAVASCASGAGLDGNQSIWYRYTPTVSGPATITSSGFNTILAVYTGTAFPLTELVCRDFVGAGGTETAPLTVTAGTTYYIRINGRGGATGTATVTVTAPVPPPANDNLAAAIAIAANGGTVTGTNVNATREAGEAPASCVTPANDGAQSIWYSYTPSVTGSTTITAGGFDTILSVYTGMAPSLTEVACRDASTGTESATLNVTAGTRYYIRVNGYAGATGTATVTVTAPTLPPAPPANDSLANAVQITATGTAVTGTNVGATLETGELIGSCATSAQAASVWWEYTPSSSAPATFDLSGSGFDTVLSVHTGTEHPLDEEACNDDEDFDNDVVTSLVSDLAVTAGTTYYIRISGFATATGAISLTVTGPAPAITQALSDGAGYRLLSVPVPGVTVDALAAVNLVQGIAAAAQPGPNEAQYPDAVPNLFTAYTPGAAGDDVFGSYTRPASTSEVIEPGEGFFWQFYDQRIDPDDTAAGGGTSESYELPARQLFAAGTPITTDHSVVFTTPTSDQFYMIGNPFARPLSASAITVPGGLQGGQFQAFRPSPAGYVQIFQSGMGSAQTALAVWQGVFAETISDAAPTFSFDFDAAEPTEPPFVGRQTPVQTVALTLSGTTAAGAETLDESAYVRFADDATAGWDALDASKLTPPAGPYALLAPTLDRDGAPYRVAISALPADAAEAYVPLAFTATAAGTYTVEADLSGLPEGWTATLRDLTTGAIVDLAAGHTFTADATDWTDRFVLHVTNGTVVSTEPTAPAAFALAAPAPNPTSSSATVAFDVPEASDVSVAVYDLLGRRVAVLAQGQRAPGHHTARMEAGTFAPGVYVVRMEAGAFSATRRVTVVR